ncbi:SRPBCC domain-containing protein [Streptomyces sp. ACA25]|uniref:SRPBCC domain-containing protein n=1 Tax=Streptomyces sp. ACA25 TaxID=3022596 RepID=UPI0023081445|nr:SRPBCC domain-containing protein [Streptomyces sp. ACA25]MDB1086037.1 SRPBCC domain-containing protein [Streptomyces sp. ACA25]
MEHEVYVPFSAAVVRSALTQPDRVVRCVPGLQLDEEADPAAPEGRLRLRIGNSTITYRGTLAASAHGEGITVEGKAREARGSGSIRLVLTVVPRPVRDGSGATLAFTGSVEGSGRIAEFPPRQREAAARRLLDRFTEALIGGLPQEATGPPPGSPGTGTAPPEGTGIGAPDDNAPVIPGIPAPESGTPSRTDSPAGQGPAGPAGAEDGTGSGGAEPGHDAGEAAGAGQQTGAGAGREPADGARDPRPHPQESVVPGPESSEPPGTDGPPASAGGGEPSAPEASPPEADVARRTMIGRSAEEVDHAPPRGRYAPAPPQGPSAASGAVLRWAAPAAAAAVAAAVVVGRVLRRRR